MVSVLGATLAGLRLPGSFALRTLRTATSPSVIQTLSLAIAQGSIQVSRASDEVEIEGIDIEIDFDQERLLTTAGVASAIALGTVYWLGSNLKMAERYARMTDALRTLNSAVVAGDTSAVQGSLEVIDSLSNPLIDPETLLPLENADEVGSIYEVVMKKPAQSGSMFNASTFTSQIADDVGRASFLIAAEATEEAVEAMAKRSAGIAGKGIARVAGRFFLVDTVYWLGTSVIDVGLNYLGIPEDKQRIPFLADIPFIGGLFDLSDSTGASAVDLVLNTVFDGIVSILGLEDETEVLLDALFGIIISAGLNPAIAPFIIAILDFYVEEVSIDFTVALVFNINAIQNGQVDFWKVFRPEPLDVLILWTYAIVAKIVFKAWIVPSVIAFRSSIRP